MSGELSLGWTLFIVILTVANILGCLWLIWWTAKRRPGDEVEGAVKSHVWDDDLQELNNPMPRWWLNLFVLTIVFALVYLVLYPGFGSFAGTLGWSQQGQHDAKLAEIQERRQAFFSRFEGQDIPELAGTLEAVPVAARLFADHCAGCHGPSGEGALGFPNLADDDWLYGSSPEQIRRSIAEGRRGVMPAFLGQLEPAMATDLMALVANWNAPPLSGKRLAEVRQKFATSCGACHGQDGTGNSALGAPDLTDDTWLYGSDPEQIRQSILFGRQGEMPAHKNLLSEVEIRLLSAYVYRMSGGFEQ